MDKSTAPRINDPRYKLRVEEFLKFSYRHKHESLEIPCPCKVCNNFRDHKKSTIYSHLMQKGFSASHDNWTRHEESSNNDEYVSLADEEEEEGDVGHENMNDDDADDDFDEMFDNIGQSKWGTDWKTSDESSSTLDKDLESLRRLLGDSNQDLYKGCKNYSKFSFIVAILHVKTISGWTNKSFDLILDVFRKALPTPSCVPINYYEAKTYIRDLGFKREKIHACVNDCVLYRKKYKSLTHCPIPKCKEPRYKGKDNNVPRKVLHYFPLIPRLQRLFIDPKVACDMRWHREKRVDDGNVLRHPADSKAWKRLDKVDPSFANDPRSVRLGLATDGFNPFGNLSSLHSTWPVFVVPYNLPPWKCMKDPYILMSMLIPGPTSPGDNIDVYLQPLIDELNELWKGVEAYDAHRKETFSLRAALLWTINDFPAYGMLSGWTVKGYNACPTCMNDTSSHYLTHSRKVCYMGHRRFLPISNRWRKDTLNFDGKIESREPIIPMSGDEVLHDIDSFINGNNRKRKRSREKKGWKKKSVFFELPYWSKLKLRHNIDIMHVVKNLTESLLATLFNISGKTKDTWKSRMDLMVKGLKKSLHLQEDGNSFIMPMACYHLTKDEKRKILDFLKSLKFPDGFASNISRCIKEEEFQLSRMKSHDFYVFIQRVLPLSIRGSLTREVRIVLYELSEFIRIMCARNMQLDVLEEQEAKIVVILCKLEKIFPESFFDIMIHLLIHLPSEAKETGPPQYRWMFPFESFRKMRTLKGYVKNTARAEGCIVERYIDYECLTFCSRYLNDAETIFNKVERNNEMVDSGGEISIFSCKGRPFGITEERIMNGTELGAVHTYILNNCSELKELENEHKAKLEAENNSNVNETHDRQFTYWLQQRVNDCQESSEIRVLSRGPLSMNRYNGCMVNGYRFHTEIREIDRKTQDSGIVVKGEYGEDIIDYYGILKEVLEVEYLGENKRVLVFKCDWFKVDDKKGIQVDRESTAISINMSRKWFKDQPYILASQAKQVFYAPDLKLGKNWYVVENSPPRKLFDVPLHEVYQEHEAHSSVISNSILEPSSLTRGTIPLELVEASTVQSSQNHHGKEEYNSDDEEIDTTNLEFSENEESSQEEYSDSD